MARNRIACLMMISALMFVSGCVSVSSRWEETQRMNTVGAYESFLREFPNAEYSSQASARIEELKFDNAKRAGADAAYRQYLRDYPSGRFAEDARKAIIAIAFEQASQRNTVEAYEQFQKRHPQSELAAQAGQKVRTLRLAEARQAGTVAEYEQFLKRYPEGGDSDALRKELPAMREWEPKKRLGELVISLSPVMRVSMGSGYSNATLEPQARVQDVLPELKRLLEAGVDPNTIRIRGFAPSSRKPLGGGAELVSSGSPGEVVPADKGGMTLLEYCKTNKFEEVAEVLKSHGAK